MFINFEKPDSIREHIARDEQYERRREAYGRFRRQQFDLFELASDPGCPNCSAVGGRPVESQDGDEGCTLCVRVRQ